MAVSSIETFNLRRLHSVAVAHREAKYRHFRERRREAACIPPQEGRHKPLPVRSASSIVVFLGEDADKKIIEEVRSVRPHAEIVIFRRNSSHF